MNLSRNSSFLKTIMKVLVLSAIFVLGSYHLEAQPAKTVKIGDLQKMIELKSDKILVVNFWATWCAPCIKELPQFEQVTTNRNDVEVNLVSIDLDLDPDPDKVYRFMARKKLKSTVLLLDERDPNSWIDKIDTSWEGAIPATLVVNRINGKRKFVGKELREGELEKLVDSVK